MRILPGISSGLCERNKEVVPNDNLIVRKGKTWDNFLDAGGADLRKSDNEKEENKMVMFLKLRNI